MASSRRPWFRISDVADLRTIAKAFVVAGVITSDPGLSATSKISALRARLRRLLGYGRSNSVTWEYPAANSRIYVRYSDVELAELFDEVTANRQIGTGSDLWSAALRLEVPVSTTGTGRIGGIAGLSPEEIFSALGVGVGDTILVALIGVGLLIFGTR